MDGLRFSGERAARVRWKRVLGASVLPSLKGAPTNYQRMSNHVTETLTALRVGDYQTARYCSEQDGVDFYEP